MMRQRLSTIGVILLVLAIMVVGLGACARSVPDREAPAATSDDTGETGAGETTPAPGETVVSAVTPISPGTEDQPTQAPADETPDTAEPEATTVPVPTVPVVQPTSVSGGDGSVQHTVQPGETLSSIAQRYGTTVEALMQANGLNSTSLYTGQVLTIPASSGGTSGCRIRHTVQSGEWVWQIARNYGVSPYDILALNGLTVQSAQTIYPGTVLCIP
ncbi:MAG: LysM peptidoglycan-binding domain-containing protein [Anaerolineae bacterium]|jgi:LysM repeat protein